MLQIGKGLVGYVIEGKVASMMVSLPPLIIYFPFVQQLCYKPFLIACHDLQSKHEIIRVRDSITDFQDLQLVRFIWV